VRWVTSRRSANSRMLSSSALARSAAERRVIDQAREAFDVKEPVEIGD
jgi:hypothetical protein